MTAPIRMIVSLVVKEKNVQYTHKKIAPNLQAPFSSTYKLPEYKNSFPTKMKQISQISLFHSSFHKLMFNTVHTVTESGHIHTKVKA